MQRMTLGGAQGETAGKERKKRMEFEAGLGELKGKEEPLPAGLGDGRDLKESPRRREADYRRRREIPPRPSYWGEAEARENGKKD